MSLNRLSPYLGIPFDWWRRISCLEPTLSAGRRYSAWGIVKHSGAFKNQLEWQFSSSMLWIEILQGCVEGHMAKLHKGNKQCRKPLPRWESFHLPKMIHLPYVVIFQLHTQLTRIDLKRTNFENISTLNTGVISFHIITSGYLHSRENSTWCNPDGVQKRFKINLREAQKTTQ